MTRPASSGRDAALLPAPGAPRRALGARSLGGGLRTRLVLGFGTVAALTAVLTVLGTGVVFVAVEFYDPYAVVDLAHFVFGSTPRISVTVAVFALVAAVLLGAAITVGVALLVARRVLSPVGQLAAAADRVAAGDLEVRLAPRGRDELAALGHSFNRMTQQLAESVSVLRRHEAQARRFASDVSHELRSPLAAMTAVTELFEASQATRAPEEARATRLIVTGIRRLEVLVEDLIEISRMDAGTATLRRESVRLADALAGALAMRDWTDAVQVEVPAELTLDADPRRLDVILANLIGNALAHGAPPVQVLARIGSGPAGAELRLSVRDHGPGMTPEVRAAVFDRFYKADDARSPTGGSGLGMSIALENARLHGGDIHAANAPDGPGALFTLTLPLGA